MPSLVDLRSRPSGRARSEKVSHTSRRPDSIHSIRVSDDSGPFHISIMRPTFVEVRLSRLCGNLTAIKQHVGRAQVMAILKANAYGHGLEPVARTLAPLADAFGVALVEEGIALRRLGIANPILVFGGTWTRQIPLFLEHA